MGNSNAAVSFPSHSLPLNEAGVPYVTMKHTKPGSSAAVVGAMTGPIIVPREVSSSSQVVQFRCTRQQTGSWMPIREETFRNGSFMYFPPKCVRSGHIVHTTTTTNKKGTKGKKRERAEVWQTCTFKALTVGQPPQRSVPLIM